MSHVRPPNPLFVTQCGPPGFCRSSDMKPPDTRTGPTGIARADRADRSVAEIARGAPNELSLAVRIHHEHGAAAVRRVGLITDTTVRAFTSPAVSTKLSWVASVHERLGRSALASIDAFPTVNPAIAAKSCLTSQGQGYIVLIWNLKPIKGIGSRMVS
jgi:hypothetical protein